MRVVNQTLQPQMLEDETILTAADTPGAQREVETLSPGDRRRLLQTDKIALVETEPAAGGATTETAQTGEGQSTKVRTK